MLGDVQVVCLLFCVQTRLNLACECDLVAGQIGHGLDVKAKLLEIILYVRQNAELVVLVSTSCEWRSVIARAHHASYARTKLKAQSERICRERKALVAVLLNVLGLGPQKLHMYSVGNQGNDTANVEHLKSAVQVDNVRSRFGCCAMV